MSDTMTATNPFEKSAQEARQRGESELARRFITEGKIVARIVDQSLSAGYVISVNDGEETVVHRSADRDTILAACFSTDEDYLTIRVPDTTHSSGTRHFGRIYLVYGNGNEVISDYASKDLDAFSDWMKPVEDFAEEA